MSGLKHLSALPKLTSLELSDCPIDNAGLAGIRTAVGLDYLGLSDTSVGDDGLENIAPLTGLTALDLCNHRVTDAGLVHLRRLTKLNWLRLTHSNITDAGLVHLRGLSSLADADSYRYPGNRCRHSGASGRPTGLEGAVGRRQIIGEEPGRAQVKKGFGLQWGRKQGRDYRKKNAASIPGWNATQQGFPAGTRG